MEPVREQRIYANRYVVTHLIARGGMALVYRADDRALGRPVALKVLYPELSTDPTFVERFRREAQAAANLSHPHIVPVFDWGEDQGSYFIAMELIDGRSFADLIKAGQLPSPTRAAQSVANVAAALGYAHRQGVVHRDVKPGNILLTADGQVKVTDFGIAQAVATTDHLATSGSVMGTATYFSPEQARGLNVDGRSDVYSLGIVLYELLCGRAPFVGDVPADVARQHVQSSIPLPSTLRPDIPRDLEAVTMKALAKDPAQRYASAEEFSADLLRFAEGKPVTSSRAGAFAADDSTRSVAAVSVGERTQAVPVMTGPRTDVRRRRNTVSPAIASAAVVVLLAVAGLLYFMTGTSTTTTMPNLVGKQVADAIATLQADGLQVGATHLIASKRPNGEVVSTNPKSGTHVSPGEAVTLEVSLGSSTQPVTIPDVTGQSIAVAQASLQSANLSVRMVFTTSAPPGGATPDTVLSQLPIGGTAGHTGDIVTLTVLSPSAQYPVPSVAGMTTLAAATTLGQAGLSVSATTTSTCSNTVAPGNVVDTSPTQGTLVKSGDSVTLVVASAVCNVVVPKVTGLTLTAATTSLTGQGLVGVSSKLPANQCSLADAGLVMSQDQSPGESIPYNSIVNLTYCG